ncbi:hypothetical protein Bca4012_097965 [Brassica carinata]|uniref:Uncharacterized protein n=1 Tax=Brassica carinata TaxID=52824 RepID=A0A8X7PFU4_BRACI|nr:hypothetical protein Bca52824_080656 [Brassica carinata]
MGSGLETGRSIWMNCRPNRNLEDPGPTALPNEIPAENRSRQRGGGVAVAEEKSGSLGLEETMIQKSETKIKSLKTGVCFF